MSILPVEQELKNLLEEMEKERKRQGVSVVALSRKCGVVHNNIYRWIHGRVTPTLFSFLAVLDGLGKRMQIVDKEE